MANNVNTIEYWNKRFKTNWTEAGGRNQTRGFMNAIINNLPEKIKQDIENNKLSIIDYGCGIAEGVKILGEVFNNSLVSGVDHSDVAIKINEDEFSDYRFESELFESDIIISSNTIEHDFDTLGFIKKMVEKSNKYVIVLAPYNEDIKNVKSTQEHVSKITEKTFPEKILNFKRIFIKNNIETSMWLYGTQIMAIYQIDKRIKLKRS